MNLKILCPGRVHQTHKMAVLEIRYELRNRRAIVQEGVQSSRVRRVGVFYFGTERVGYVQKRSGTGTGRDG